MPRIESSTQHILPLYSPGSNLKAAVTGSDTLQTRSIEQAPTSCKPGLKAVALSAIALVGAGIYCARGYFGDSSATALSKVAQDGLDISHRLVNERAVPTAVPLGNQAATTGNLFQVSHQFFTDADGGFVQPKMTQGPSWLNAQLNPIVSNYATPANARTVQVIGTTAYVACDTSGLQIIDISTPSSPTLIGASDTPGTAVGAYVVGTTAYIADYDQGLRIINITQPDRPTLIGVYNPGGKSYRVPQVIGTTAYVGWDGGLRIINITNPSSPTLIGTYSLGGYYGRAVQVIGTTAYVAADGLGLKIINVANPSSPTLIGTYDTPGTAVDVYVVGTIAYVADWGSGLQIVNITTPSTPTLIETYSLSAARAVQVIGNTAYVADQSGGVQIINVYNPSAPTLFGICTTAQYAYGVYVIKTTAYVANFNNGLQILSELNYLQLSGTPKATDQGNYIVTLMGTTTAGTVSTSFNLNVATLLAPVYQNPISIQQALVDTSYIYVMPDNVFVDPNGYAMTYRAKDLPPWLTFNIGSRIFSGKPTSGDTGTFADKSTTVTVIANDGKLETTGQFTMTVSGESYLTKIIKVAGPILSGLGTLYSGYKNRALLLDQIAKRKWENNQMSVKLGEDFSYVLQTDINDIRKVQAYVRDKGVLGKMSEKLLCGKQRHIPLAVGLPTWMSYIPEINALLSKRPLEEIDFMGYREMQIRVLGGGGVIKELLKLQLDGGAQALEGGIDPMARQERIGLLLSPTEGTNFIEMDGIRNSDNQMPDQQI